MFFTVSLSKDGSRLSWSMSPVLRATLVFALLSVIAAVFFSLTGDEYRSLGPIGRANVVVLPVLLFLGSLYEYRLVFDKTSHTVTVRSGLLFLARTKRYSLESVQRLVLRVIHPSHRHEGEAEFASTGLRRSRAFVGFLIDGKLIVLDRACSQRTARGWVQAFRAFMPFAVEEGT